MNSTRTPFILVLLKLPVKIIRLTLYLCGALTYLPIYIYCLLFSKFLFHPSFDQSQSFYMIFSVPRAVLSLGGFVIGGGELYLIYRLIEKFAEFHSRLAVVIILASVIGFTLFSFRFGYKLLFNRLKFPQLKSVKEHLELALYGIQDILSVIFTILTILLAFRFKEPFRFKPDPQKRTYFTYSWKMFIYSLYDLVCVTFWVILFICHWRYPYTRRVIPNIKSEEKKSLFIMNQALNALFDLIFIPLLLIVILNPFLKGRRLLSHMNKLSVITWRRLIFDEVLNSLVDLLCFAGFVLPLLTIFEIPLCFTLYKSILKITKPLDFKENTSSLQKINDHQEQTKLGLLVHDHIRAKDSVYREKCWLLTEIAFSDILILIAKVTTMLSVYRHLTFQKRMKVFKMKIANEPYANNTSYSYSEYRNFMNYLLIIDKERKISFCGYFNYRDMIISELWNLILDIPVIVISVLLILAPWRIKDVIKNINEDFKKIGDNNNKKEMSLRMYIISCSFLGFVDYICFILALFAIIGVWRWNYLFPELKKLFKNDLQALEKEKGRRFLTKFDFLDYILYKTVAALLIDVLFLPVLILFAPFYIICFWRVSFLIKCLKMSFVSDFSFHRKIILFVGINCIEDFLSFFPLLLTILTVYRIPTLKTLKTLEKNLQELSGKRLIKETIPNNNEDKKEFKSKGKNLGWSAYENGKKSPIFKAGRKCVKLLLLDILSIPFMVLSLPFPSTMRRFYTKLKAYKETQEKTGDFYEYYKIEKKKVFLRFASGIEALITILVGILVACLFFLLLWRLPTFFMILKSEPLKKLVLKQILKDDAKIEKNQKRLLNVISILVFFSFYHILVDLLISPIFIALFLLTPWRSSPVVKSMYKYDTKTPLGDQIIKQRVLVLEQFQEGLRDYYALFKILVIICTIIRIPFFFMIILKNRYPNSSLSKRLFIQYQIPVNEKNESATKKEKIDTKLPWKKCISITYKELLKDLPFLLLGSIIIVIAPWRIISIVSIIASQIDRIPSHDIEAKKAKLYSKRQELFYMLGKVFVIDYIQIFKMTIITLTIHRFPKLFKIWGNLFLSLVKDKEQFSVIREIDIEFKKSLNDFTKLFCLIIIFAFVLRVKTTLKRLKAYNTYIKAKKRESEYKQHHKDETTGEEKLSFNDITWDTYGRICQYLTVPDLGKLSQVNKKFYNLNKKDFYWEYQFKRDWSKHRGINENVTFKDKCVSAFNESMRYKVKTPLTTEERDILYGSAYIVFDEAVETLRYLPHFILLPQKLLAYTLMHLRRFLTLSGAFPIRTTYFTDALRIFIRGRNIFLIRDKELEGPFTFETIDYSLFFWIKAAVFKYICEFGYLLGYIGYLLVKWTSAGEIAHYEIQFHENFVQLDHQIDRLRMAQAASYWKRFIFYYLQLIATGFFFYILFQSFTIMPYVLRAYFGWGWFFAIFGPCLLCFVHYVATINAIISVGKFIYISAPHFRPHLAFVVTFRLILGAIVKAYNTVAKPLFDRLARGIKMSLRTFIKIFRLISSNIKKAFLLVYGRFVFAGKGIVSIYLGILRHATRISLKYGIVGDLFLTVFALIWMLWPVLIPFYLPNKIYFIPCGLLGAVLMVVGYKTIQKVTKSF